MKKVTYQCQICRTDFSEDSAHKSKLILACYFTSYQRFELRELPAETDCHICKNCIESIVATNGNPKP